jgi:hypothetical protein
MPVTASLILAAGPYPNSMLNLTRRSSKSRVKNLLPHQPGSVTGIPD